MSIFDLLGFLGLLTGLVIGSGIGLYLGIGWWILGTALTGMIIGWIFGVCLGWLILIFGNKLRED